MKFKDAYIEFKERNKLLETE